MVNKLLYCYTVIQDQEIQFFSFSVGIVKYLYLGKSVLLLVHFVVLLVPPDRGAALGFRGFYICG